VHAEGVQRAQVLAGVVPGEGRLQPLAQVLGGEAVRVRRRGQGGEPPEGLASHLGAGVVPVGAVVRRLPVVPGDALVRGVDRVGGGGPLDVVVGEREDGARPAHQLLPGTELSPGMCSSSGAISPMGSEPS